MKPLFSLYLLLKIGLVAYSQVVYHEYHIENKIPNILTGGNKTTTEPLVIFFIPTTGLELEDSLLYSKKVEQLVKRLQSTDLGGISLRFCYFKQDPKSNANGYLVYSKNQKDSLPIGQLECFFENFDTALVSRASKLMKNNFKVIKPFNSDNFYRVSIVDGNKCFEKLQDRIPYYFDFIKESIKPNYTYEERFEKISDTLSLVRNSVFKLREQNSLLESKIDSIRDLLQHIFLEQSSSKDNLLLKKK